MVSLHNELKRFNSVAILNSTKATVCKLPLTDIANEFASGDLQDLMLLVFSLREKVEGKLKTEFFLSCFIGCIWIYFSGRDKLGILITVPLFQDTQYF